MNRIIFILILIFIYSCGKSNSGIRNYYFPSENLDAPKVYNYKNVNDFTDNLYYAVKSIKNENSTALHIEIYDSKFIMQESVRLELNSDGAFIEEYLALVDSVQLDMKVYSDTMFLWDIDIDGKFTFEVTYNRPETFNQLIRKRNYQYKGISENKNFNGYDYKTILLKEDEFYYDGNTIKSKSVNEYFYAHGIGLIEVIRTFDNKKYCYKLDNIMTLPEWKSLKESINKPILLQ